MLTRDNKINLQEVTLIHVLDVLHLEHDWTVYFSYFIILYLSVFSSVVRSFYIAAIFRIKLYF